MSDHWRNKATRQLVKRIRDAGGSVERTGRGRIRITGPSGSVVLQEPSGETRPDLGRNSPEKKITEETGLTLD